MGFLDPLLLIALAALAVPPLIHLLERRRPRRVQFAALDFILRSQRKSARRFRLRQLLLLAVRMALIAALVFAVARPQWLTEVATIGSSGPPTATVVVLDDSLSMQLTTREGVGGLGAPRTLFEQARQQAAEVFSGQRLQDSGALVLAGAPLRGTVVQPSFDRAPLLAALDRLQPSYRGTDLAGAMAQAAELLAASPLPHRRIVVIGDLQAAGFDAARLPRFGGEGDGGGGKGASEGIEVLPLSVAPTPPASNRAVVELKVTPATDQGPLAYRIQARLAAFGPAPGGPVQVRLEIDGELANAGTVQFQQGRADKEFLHTFAAAGAHRGAVVLAADDLTADDRRDFTLEVQQPVRALLVDGDPRPTPQQDELFYLERALRPGDAALSRVVPTIIGVPLLAGADLSAYDVVVLANVSGLSADLVSELERFVRQGGGLLITGGDNVDPERYNQELLPLLPRPLRDVWRVSPTAASEPEQFGPARGSSRVLGPLLGPGGEGLRAARFHAYLLLEPGAGGGGSGGGELTTHLTFSSGAPALVEKKLGRGSVALFTSSVDRDWTDLPIRTGFLPLLQETLQQLAGTREGGMQPPVLVGQPLTLPRPSWAQQVLVQAPGDRRLRPLAQAEGSERRTVAIPQTEVPGILRVALTAGGDGPSAEESRAIVTDPVESDLTPLGQAEVAALTGGGGGADGKPTAQTSQRPYNLWPWALLLLVLLLLGEGVLLLRREVLERVRVDGGARG